MKNFKLLITCITALSFIFLFSGNVAAFGLFQVVSVSLIYFSGYKTSGITSVCSTACAIADIATDDDCNIRGGLLTGYWAKYSDIDWADMAGDALLWDSANKLILGYTMVGGAVFKKLTFERKSAFYNFTFTSDADVYEQIVTMIFEGKGNSIKNAIENSIGCCQLVLHLFDNNCLERVIGVEWDGTAFSKQIKPLKLNRHLDASGQFGTDKAREELDLTGESLTAPLYATVTQTGIPV